MYQKTQYLIDLYKVILELIAKTWDNLKEH